MAFRNDDKLPTSAVRNIQFASGSQGTLKVARNPAINTNVTISDASSEPAEDNRNGYAADDSESTTNIDEIARAVAIAVYNAVNIRCLELLLLICLIK